MDRLDTLVAGTVGMLLITAFLIGLANSIHAVPFWIITLGVLVLALADYYEGCIRSKRNNKGGARKP